MQLLDVNLLIALCDADHEHHALAKSWFQAHSGSGWATCPLTENALLRIMGQPAYPGGPGSPDAIRPLLQRLRSLPGHQFWPDAVSFADKALFPSLDGISSKALTDLYLLALAVRHKGRFITFDTRVDPASIPGGTKAFHCIGRKQR